MGSYLNPGSKGFQESLNSEIYVDKTGLIEKTNAVLNTRQKFIWPVISDNVPYSPLLYRFYHIRLKIVDKSA